MESQTESDKNEYVNVEMFRADLLNWYDHSRRVLPWRAAEGVTPNPYHVWLSEIMLQQTVVAAVIPYFLKFVEKWPTIKELAGARQEEIMEAWAGLGYYSRARNLHKCANQIIEEFNGEFPQTQNELKKLPGVGDYTSAAITAIAFDRPATVIDGNVDRVIARFFAITEPLPASKPDIRENAAYLSEARTDRPGDFAQAMMDLGATICTPKSPKCTFCPLMKNCEGYSKGLAADLPYKLRKKTKPQKQGFVYWVESENTILVERRPETGMLASMLGLPTSKWDENPKNIDHPELYKDCTVVPVNNAVVSHSFTHFDLELKGYRVVNVGKNYFCSSEYSWLDKEDLAKLGLPTLFKKFVKLMLNDKA